MLFNESIAELRTRLDDVAAPPLWSDRDLVRYLNSAENEACERALLIEEDAPADSKAVTSLTQVGGVATLGATAHGFTAGERVRVAGADQAAYNGLQIVATTPDADSLTFPVDAGAGTPATGTITIQSDAASMVNLAGLANRAQYTLDTRIIEVRSVLWDGTFLHGVSRDTLNHGRLGSNSEAVHYRYPFSWPWFCGYCWPTNNTDWSALSGDPRLYIDPQEKYLRLVRIPARDAAIHLSVYRRPLAPLTIPANALDADGNLIVDEDDGTTFLTADTQSFEIAETYHMNVLLWAEHLAYSKRDADAHDAKLADARAADFTAAFGVRQDANVKRKQRARQNHTVAFNPDW